VDLPWLIRQQSLVEEKLLEELAFYGALRNLKRQFGLKVLDRSVSGDRDQCQNILSSRSEVLQRIVY